MKIKLEKGSCGYWRLYIYNKKICFGSKQEIIKKIITLLEMSDCNVEITKC